MNIAVIGEGAWGIAIATILAYNGHNVNLWCYDPDVVTSIKTSGINERYMPGVKLSPLIHPTTSMEEAVSGVEYIFEAIPVKYMRSVLTQAEPFVKPEHQWIVLSKGIEQETLMLPAQIVEDIFGTTQYAVCMGPSFAREVVNRQFTGMVLATKDTTQSTKIKQLLENEYIKISESDDIIGTQIGAALKNVIALGVGILDGAGYGENTKALVLTYALQDMVVCSQALGGRIETIYGLSGVGDLVLTCMGGLSRNLMVGTYFGRGQSLEEIIREKGVIPEGVNTAQSIYTLAQKYGIMLPVCQGVHDMIFKGLTVDLFLKQLS